MKNHTCDQCENYAPPVNMGGDSIYWVNAGGCSRMGTWQGGPAALDDCGSGECDDYDVPVYVGPKFGCIHWQRKLGEK